MEKPDKISIAVKLFILSLAIGILTTAINLISGNNAFHQLSQQLSPEELDKLPVSLGIMMSVMISILIAAYAFIILLVYKIDQGRKWARTIYLVLFIIGMIWTPFTLYRQFNANPVDGTIVIIQKLLQIVALIFLFNNESNDWYNRNKKKSLQD